MKWRYLLLICTIWLVTSVNAAEHEPLKSQITKGLDKESGLEYQMEILRDSDNGVYGLLISIKNLSDKNDVFLKMPEKVLEAVMVVIRSDKGEMISIPPKIYLIDGAEQQKFATAIVPKLGVQEWFVPIRDVIQNRVSLGNEIKGRIVMSLAVDYKLIEPDKSQSVRGFKHTDFNLDAGNLLFTSQSLEGDPHNKFAHRNNAVK